MQHHQRAATDPTVPRLLFAAMSLVWGLTWIAIKTGVTAIPPLFFAGTRFIAAGLLLLAWERIVGNGDAGAGSGVRREDWPKLLVATLLMIVATYTLLFWGTAHVASGLASVINLALTPVALFGIGLAYPRGALQRAAHAGDRHRHHRPCRSTSARPAAAVTVPSSGAWRRSSAARSPIAGARC